MRRRANPLIHCVLSLGLLAFLLATPNLAAQELSQPETPTSSQAKPLINPDGTYHPGNGVTNPRLVHSVDVMFSDAARRKNVTGATVVAMVVGIDGLPMNVHVTRSAAEGQKPKLRKAASSLDENALDAVRQYRFEPGMYQGKPVPVAITVEVNFRVYPKK